MREVDPSDPATALRLAKAYPGAVTAMLPEHEGRSYANLLAAYCLVWSNDPAIQTILAKGILKCPGMVSLVAEHLNSVLRHQVEFWNKLYGVEASMQEQSDFIDMVTSMSKMVS